MVANVLCRYFNCNSLWNTSRLLVVHAVLSKYHDYPEISFIHHWIYHAILVIDPIYSAWFYSPKRSWSTVIDSPMSRCWIKIWATCFGPFLNFSLDWSRKFTVRNICLVDFILLVGLVSFCCSFTTDFFYNWFSLTNLRKIEIETCCYFFWIVTLVSLFFTSTSILFSHLIPG